MTSIPLPVITLPLTPDRQEELLHWLNYAIKLVASLPVRRTCTLCDQFKPEAWCNVWSDNVPESAQADGCDQWVPLIPF
jgi:hypothetical protein